LLFLFLFLRKGFGLMELLGKLSFGMRLLITMALIAAIALAFFLCAWVLAKLGERRGTRQGFPPRPPARSRRGAGLVAPPLPPQEWGQTISGPMSGSMPVTGTGPVTGELKGLASTLDASPPPQVAQPAQPAPTTSAPDLSLGTFAPVSDEETRKQAQGINLWSSIGFGRRDLIPPVTDPRTLLIDKAMVAHGLITPEELAEIHRVGQQMDQVRPDMSIAYAQGAAEAQRLEEDRAALKARKKAEAAERKRLHAEAVAQRKSTDIIFLGRGVSSGLADRNSDVEKLRAAGRVVLSAPADVASALGVSIPRLRWLAFHSEAATRTHYVRFEVPKKSGGKRLLFAPHRDLAAAQEWILRNVLDKVPVHAAAQGFVKGRNTVSNASPHVKCDVVVNADLENFFPTITFPRVRGIFKQLGYSPAVATVFALICTESPRRVATYAGKPLHVAAGPRALPQGACTSPALSNLAARRLDSRLAGIAARLGWKYTRYADDMSFSTSGEPSAKVGYLLARLRHIARDEGFVVNEKKTRVLRQSVRQNVTGVVVNARPGAPRPLVRRLRAILHRAKFEGLAKQNRLGHPHFEAWVEGMVAYVSMLNPKQGGDLRAALDGVRGR
jgi:retron-type reverse transcriptase